MSEFKRAFIPADQLGVSPKQPDEEREARIEEIVRTEAQNYLQAAYQMIERPLQQHQMDRIRPKVQKADREYDLASGVAFEVTNGDEALPTISRLLADESGARFESLNEVSNRIEDFANPKIDGPRSYNFPDQVESLNTTTRELFKIIQKDFSFSLFGQENLRVLTQAFISRITEALRDEDTDVHRKKSGEKRTESITLSKDEAQALQKTFYEFLQKKRPEVADKLMTYMSQENANSTVYLEQIITAQDIVDFFDLVDLGEVVMPFEVKNSVRIADLIKEFLKGFKQGLQGGEPQNDLIVASRKVRRFGQYAFVADQVLGPATPLPELEAQKRALFMPSLDGPRGRSLSDARKLIQSRDVIKKYNDTMTAYLNEVKVTPDNPHVDNAWMVREVTNLLMAVEAVFHDLNVNLDQELKEKVYSLDLANAPKARMDIRYTAIKNALTALVQMQKPGYDRGLIDLEKALESAIHPRTLDHYFKPVQSTAFGDKEIEEFAKNSKSLADFTQRMNELIAQVQQVGEKVRERNTRVRELALRYFQESNLRGDEVTQAEVQGELENLGIDGEVNPALLARLREDKTEMSLDELLQSSQSDTTTSTQAAS